jgi:hypothetical protein
MRIVILAFLVATIAFWWYQATRQRKRRLALTGKRNTDKTYHCVEVRTGTPACEAAKQFGSTRFLSAQAPILPVSGCTLPICKCSYIHHNDRREDDRRNPYGRWSTIPPAIVGERRARADRRKSQEGAYVTSWAR